MLIARFFCIVVLLFTMSLAAGRTVPEFEPGRIFSIYLTRNGTLLAEHENGEIFRRPLNGTWTPVVRPAGELPPIFQTGQRELMSSRFIGGPVLLSKDDGQIWSIAGTAVWPVKPTPAEPVPDHHLVTTASGLAFYLAGKALYRSVDGGRRWTTLQLPPNLHSIRSRMAMRAGGRNLYLFSNGHLARSTDLGKTWTIIPQADMLRSPMRYTNGQVPSFWIGAGERLIALSGREFVESTDGGSNWVVQRFGLPAHAELELDWQDRDGALHLLVASSSDASFHKHWRVNAAGRAVPFQNVEGGALFQLASAGDHMVQLSIGSRDLYESHDGGRRWTKVPRK